MTDTKVRLLKVSGPYVNAPDFCPFQEDGKIHSSVCQLCKYCDFTPEIDTDIKVTSIPKKVQESIAHFMCFKDTSSMNLLTSQSNYLRKKDRIPIIIVTSVAFFNKVIDVLKLEHSSELLNSVQYLAIEKNQAICKILGSPVYVSSKLTRADIQVVGEIEWQT